MSNFPSAHHHHQHHQQSPNNMGNMGMPPPPQGGGGYGGGGGPGGPPNNMGGGGNPNSNWNGPGGGGGNFGGPPHNNNNFGGGPPPPGGPGGNFGGGGNNMGSPSYGGGGGGGPRGGGPPSQGPPNWNGGPQGNNMGGPGPGGPNNNNNFGGPPNNNNNFGGGNNNFGGGNNNNNFSPSSPMGPGGPGPSGPPNYNNNNTGGPGGPPPPHLNNNNMGGGPNRGGGGGSNNLPSYGPGGGGNNNQGGNNQQQQGGGPPPPFNPNHPSQPHHPGGGGGNNSNSNMNTPNSMQHSMPPPPHHGGSGGRGRGGSPTSQGAPSFSNYNNNNNQGGGDNNMGGGGGGAGNFPARAPPSHQQRIHTAPLPQGGFAAPPQTMVGGGGPNNNNSNQGNNNQGPPPPHHGGGGSGGPHAPPPHTGGPQHHGMPPPPNFPPNNNNPGNGPPNMGGGGGGPPPAGFLPNNSSNPNFNNSMNPPAGGNNNNNFGSGPSGPPPHQGPGPHGTPPSMTHSSNPQTPQINAAQHPNNMRGGPGGVPASVDSGIPEASPDLFQFLDSKNLIHSAPLSDLRKVVCGGFKQELNKVMLDQDPVQNPIRMAIDGNNILTNIMKEINAEDPLWLLAGPYPPSLIPKLQKLVGQLKSNGVAPVFVFSGMAVHGDVESFVNTREEMIERDQIWFQVANRSPIQTDQIERAFDIVLGEDVEMMVMRHLQNELGCTVFRAPFLQWGQMVAFTLPNMKFCSALWGPPEVLLLDSVKRVLIDLDFNDGTINYADKEEIIEKLFSDLPESQTQQDKAALFLDLALLTASHQALILLRPPIENGTLPYMYNLLRQLASQGSKVSDYVCSSFPDKKVANSQTWKFLKGRCYVRHCMVLIPDATKDNLVPLSKLINEADKVPRNMTGVLGSRLPLMMYYFQFIGLLSVSTMTTVSQNYIRDDNPVSDSVQYRHCMETVISLRTQVLYQLVQFLQANPDYYHRVKVSWIRWYEPITAPVRRPPEIRLAHWNLQEVPPACDLSRINFQSVIHYSHCGTSSPNTKYTNLPQVLNAIFLKSLDLLGYFTHANVDEEYPDQQQNSVEVSGMSCYSETIKTAVSQDRFVEQCVLLIELLRTKSLALTQFIVIDANNFQTAGFNDCPELNIGDAIVPLASRISSLLYIPVKSEPWPTKHFDRELMTYCVLVRNMHRTLRTTTEVIATSMFLDDSAEIPVQDWAEIPKHLPFSRPPSVAAGVLTKYLLEQQSFMDSALTPADRIHALEQEFPIIEDMPATLKLLFEFWEDAYFVLSELHQKDNMTVDENLLNVMTGCITQMRFCREHLLGETPQASFEGMGSGGGGNAGAYNQAAAGATAAASIDPPPPSGQQPAEGSSSAAHSPGSAQQQPMEDEGVEI